VPVGLVVAGANRPDLKLVPDTLESLVVKRSRPIKKRLQGIWLGKGYDYVEVRETFKEFRSPPSGPGVKKPGHSNTTRALGRGDG